MKFERGKTVEPIKKIGETKETGTKVRFLADNTITENPRTKEERIQVLEEKLKAMSDV